MKVENKKMATLVVRVRDDQKQWCVDKAQEAKIDISKFIRVVIDSFRSVEKKSLE